LDCSGFARWVYDIAYGADILNGNTKGQLALPNVKKDTTSQAGGEANIGDLVYFFLPGTKGAVEHVGIYIGDNTMIDEPNSDSSKPYLRLDPVMGFKLGTHKHPITPRIEYYIVTNKPK